MKYMSSRAPVAKDIPNETLGEVSDYLRGVFPSGIKPSHTFGDIQEALFNFRHKDGRKLLINQMAPIYLALCWGEPLV